MNMAPYHIVLVHFPIALLTTATLIVVLRALSDGALAKAADKVLTPLLGLGVLSTAAAFGVGLMVWPIETATASPLARNHLLAASWTLAYWTLLWITRWAQGESVWDGINRWIMAGLAVLGAGLLTVAGTLGGHLTGTPTAVSQLLRLLGWEVYTTFYVPDVVLGVLAVAAVALPIVAWQARRSQA